MSCFCRTYILCTRVPTRHGEYCKLIYRQVYYIIVYSHNDTIFTCTIKMSNNIFGVSFTNVYWYTYESSKPARYAVGVCIMGYARGRRCR